MIQPALFTSRTPPATTPAKPPLAFNRIPAHIPIDPDAVPFLKWAGGKRQLQVGAGDLQAPWCGLLRGGS